MRRILVTNDDGVHAPGLLALVETIRELGEVVVVAPDHNWSAAGLTRTMHKPLRLSQVHLSSTSAAYITNGAPSDCVALGLMKILPEPPALIISGINPGANLADDILYSGTVTAAMEGVIAGTPSVAVSIDKHGEDIDFTGAARFTRDLVQVILERGLPERMLLNVNVPDAASKSIAGVRITRLGRRIYKDAVIERQDPWGKDYYWIGGEKPGGVLEEGTDIWAVAHGFISITPLAIDLTAHGAIAELERWRLDGLLRGRREEI